ncbi:MAG: Nramp family divalent metal transporter [Actinomycetota bacterium]
MSTEAAPPVTGKYRLGVSRPDLEVADLPTPEEVFGVPRIGPKELIKFAIGPSLIALGISIGSGEWLLGPLNVGQFGFVGVGWVITLSILLQTFYNVEISRYVVATGEIPAVGFGRAPPGYLLWVPFAVFVVFFAFIWGGWAAAAGQGVFAFIFGRVPDLDVASELQTVRWLAIGLLVIVFVIAALSRIVSRGLELVNWAIVGFILVVLLVMDIFLVPGSIWWEGIRGLFTPARPPAGISATDIGALAGFAALASGLNWYVMGHYRDKGYGMGSRIGYIAGLRGVRKEVLAVGVTFPEDEKNTRLWKRWYRLLLLDMWVVFAVGAFLGMLLPTILMRTAVQLSGEQPTEANVPTFVASALDAEYGRFLFWLALLVGTLILFSTQLGIFEAMVRNFTDGANGISAGFRRLVEGDPRRFYFPFMGLMVIVIGVVIHLELPVGLIQISANMANFGALIFPFILIYLNSKLPRPARPAWWQYVILLINFVFFGFFFLNFAKEYITGTPFFQF